MEFLLREFQGSAHPTPLYVSNTYSTPQLLILLSSGKARDATLVVLESQRGPKDHLP